MKLLIALIKLYQHTIGLVLPPSCRFTPTCSHYAQDAIATHGILKGMLLSGWRILRCNPWCAGGFDPVPPRNNARKTWTGKHISPAGTYE